MLGYFDSDSTEYSEGNSGSRLEHALQSDGILAWPGRTPGEQCWMPVWLVSACIGCSTRCPTHRSIPERLLDDPLDQERIITSRKNFWRLNHVANGGQMRCNNGNSHGG